MIPTVDNKFEKFDIKTFEKKLNIDDSFVLLKNNDSIQQLQKQSYGYINRIFYQKNYFVLIKKFYSNCSLKEKGLLFNNGSQIGIWYHYDESGKLIKEEDTDIGYDFGPMEVLRYCKKNGISLPKGYQEYGFHTRVLKLEREGKKVWKIFYPIKSDLMKEIALDGKTGKELEIKFKPIKNS